MMMDRAPQLDRVGKHPAGVGEQVVGDERTAAFSFTVGGYVTACGTTSRTASENAAWYSRYAARSASPGQSVAAQLRRQQRIGAHVRERRRADHERVGDRCAVVAARRAAVDATSRPRSVRARVGPRLRGRTADAASAALSPSGRADHHAHCASAIAHASAGAAARGRLSGRRPHALAQLDHPQAPRRRRAARTARSAVARAGLDDAEQPLARPRARARARGSSPARAGGAAGARPARTTPSAARSSPRSTIRLSATRAVPSATPNSAHHCTSRPPGIRGRPHPEQQARRSATGPTAAGRADALRVAVLRSCRHLSEKCNMAA